MVLWEVRRVLSKRIGGTGEYFREDLEKDGKELSALLLPEKQRQDYDRSSSQKSYGQGACLKLLRLSGRNWLGGFAFHARGNLPPSEFLPGEFGLPPASGQDHLIPRRREVLPPRVVQGLPICAVE